MSQLTLNLHPISACSNHGGVFDGFAGSFLHPTEVPLANHLSLVGYALTVSLVFACSFEQAADEETVPAAAAEALSTSPIDDVVASVNDLTVRIPNQFNVPYSGVAASEFPHGLPLSIGSGLRVKRGGGPWLTLVGMTDRGPNGDALDYRDTDGAAHSTKAFLAAVFNPELVTIEFLPFLGPTVTSTTPLQLDRASVTGIPLVDATSEVALTEQLTAIPATRVGFDTEGLDFDARGNVWLCDEYGQRYSKCAHTGEIMKLLRPGSGLPNVLSSRQPTRGFEGVAVAPNGKVYGLIQSTLDIKGNTKGKAQFIRMVEYDPKTRGTRMFAYPHDIGEYAKSGDAKLGDLYAVDNEHFLTIEEGKDKNKYLRNIVYAIDIFGASNLRGVLLTSGANVGLELEYGVAAEVAA